MAKTVEFEPKLLLLIPNTAALLETSNLTLHPAVSRVVLHGSRGLAGGYRRDSDIDLSLASQSRYKKLLNPATVNRELAVLKHLFTKAVDWRVLDQSPAVAVKLHREKIDASAICRLTSVGL